MAFLAFFAFTHLAFFVHSLFSILAFLASILPDHQFWFCPRLQPCQSCVSGSNHNLHRTRFQFTSLSLLLSEMFEHVKVWLQDWKLKSRLFYMSTIQTLNKSSLLISPFSGIEHQFPRRRLDWRLLQRQKLLSRRQFGAGGDWQHNLWWLSNNFFTGRLLFGQVSWDVEVFGNLVLPSGTIWADVFWGRALTFFDISFENRTFNHN